MPNSYKPSNTKNTKNQPGKDKQRKLKLDKTSLKEHHKTKPNSSNQDKPEI